VDTHFWRSNGISTSVVVPTVRDEGAWTRQTIAVVAGERTQMGTAMRRMKPIAVMRI
jgi:histidinol-phosphate/aromatic aminotransferase/cobyric acid decarboxylase-like protein